MPRSKHGADGSISLANPKKRGCKKKVERSLHGAAGHLQETTPHNVRAHRASCPAMSCALCQHAICTVSVAYSVAHVLC